VVACAAYRSGESLYDSKYDVRRDYSRRAAGIAHSEILLPDNAPDWAADREALWSHVELKEDESKRRASAQLAREFIVALPKELTSEQRRDLVLGFVNQEFVSRGMIADVNLHAPKQGDNFHAHILCTMREIGQDGFGAKQREWNDKALLVEWRQHWERHCNAALEAAAIDAHVDCRSLHDQGIDRQPQPKMGVVATAMERKGVETRRGLVACWYAFENRIRSAVGAIRDTGEVYQVGIGETWWERAQAALGREVETVRGFLRDESSFVSMEADRRERQREPDRDKDPDRGYER
jgi:ATP-dependent exoDNAse (exonuclease V) alpha subunit